MPIEAYINFNGNCREAVEYYAKVFGTEPPKFMTFGDVPPDSAFPITDEMKNLILHTELNICGSRVMFSDTSPDMSFVPGNNISLTVVSNDESQIKTFFHKLKDNGTVFMELQQTFWSKCYGQLTDKYGIIWQLSYASK